MREVDKLRARWTVLSLYKMYSLQESICTIEDISVIWNRIWPIRQQGVAEL